MTALTWMLSWLPLILPAVGTLPKPVNISLTSLNFSYILKWEAGPGTPPGVYYNVEYTTERKHSWNPVAGCERVQKPLFCDLTAAFSVLTEKYLTRVGAQLGGQVFGDPNETEVPFKPIEHLSLPLLSVAPSDRSLSVDLHPPLERLRQSYNILRYELRISSSNPDKMEFIKTESLKSYKWDRLEPGRRYCVAVRFCDEIEDMYSNFSPPECATVPAIFSADPLISGMLCSLVIIVTFCIFMLISTGFICPRRRLLPSVLLDRVVLPGSQRVCRRDAESCPPVTMACLPLLLCLSLLLHSELAHPPPAPVNLSVDSLNFRHVLRWKPGDNTPPGTEYGVFVSDNRKKWEQQCNIPTQPQCNQTSGTSMPLMLPWWNFHYYLHVKAFFNQTWSPRSKIIVFVPYKETKLGPPEVSLVGYENYIQINISLPWTDDLPNFPSIQQYYGFRVSFRIGTDGEIQRPPAAAPRTTAWKPPSDVWEAQSGCSSL